MDSRSPSRDEQPRARRQTYYRADLPQLLRARLTACSLSQAKLSKHTSIDPSTLSKILNGKRRPNAAQLGALAYVLDLELDQLLLLPPSPDVLVERDELRAKLEEATRHADEAELARARTESAAAARIAELEAKLDEAARARASVEAELKRVEQELAAAKLRLDELDDREAWAPKPKSGRRAASSHPPFELVDFPPPEFAERRAAVERNAKTIKVVGAVGGQIASLIYRALA
jgi:transcriptional regulator with XRE-family HTH domain